jgi:hypothetical protein
LLIKPINNLNGVFSGITRYNIKRDIGNQMIADNLRIGTTVPRFASNYSVIFVPGLNVTAFSEGEKKDK